MKTNLSLYSKLISGVSLLSLIIISYSVYLSWQLRDKDRLTRIISEDIQPSITYLSELTDKYQETKSLFYYWGNAGGSSDDYFRNNLVLLFQNQINPIIDDLTILSVKWNPEDLELFKSTSTMVRDSLFYSYLNTMREFRIVKMKENLDSGIEEFMEQQSILFLLSEIEQNLNYLLDKRKIEMNNNFQLIEESASGIRKTLKGFNILIIMLILLFSAWIYLFIKKAINQLSSNLHLLNQGIIPSRIEYEKNNEIGIMFDLMNKLFAYLKNLTLVSQKINQKEFNNAFRPLSEKDELGIALLELQNNLKQASEEEHRRKIEDKERSWTAEGIAKINEILRLSSDKLEDLAFNLIMEITTYSSAQVGALYILSENDKGESNIDMIAAYAYDRRKFINKTINIGEGLVGRCVQENETIYLSEVPDNYLSIKSGLGESNPVSILIAPLHLNENVYGVIELASFSLFEPYKINFIETIGESIASSISKVKINLQTTHLLEQTRKQAEEMAAQEEEMRQNMEELRLTQELSAVREEKLKKEIETLKNKLK